MTATRAAAFAAAIIATVAATVLALRRPPNRAPRLGHPARDLARAAGESPSARNEGARYPGIVRFGRLLLS